jgi:hypothetical protein
VSGPAPQHPLHAGRSRAPLNKACALVPCAGFPAFFNDTAAIPSLEAADEVGTADRSCVSTLSQRFLWATARDLQRFASSFDKLVKVVISFSENVCKWRNRCAAAESYDGS